jgi:hypothetical protein
MQVSEESRAAALAFARREIEPFAVTSIRSTTLSSRPSPLSRRVHWQAPRYVYYDIAKRKGGFGPPLKGSGC